MYRKSARSVFVLLLSINNDNVWAAVLLKREGKSETGGASAHNKHFG